MDSPMILVLGQSGLVDWVYFRVDVMDLMFRTDEALEEAWVDMAVPESLLASCLDFVFRHSPDCLWT